MKYLLTGLCSLCLFVSHSQEEKMVGLPDRLEIILRDTAEIASEFDAVVRNNSKIILSWVSNNRDSEFFSIERSCNGKEFETIGVLKQTSGQIRMGWLDEQPAKGMNHYRIRCSAKNGTITYSGVVMAHLAGNTSFRFYPNPTDNILIVRSEQPVDLSILDASGKVRIVQNQFSGLQMLNVSSLEKGVYILQIFDRLVNTHTQEKLVKK